jgi:excisionase family DNA binding protein
MPKREKKGTHSEIIPEFYSLTQVAARLAVSTRTVRKMLMDGTIRAIKVRGQWRIHDRELERLRKGCHVPPNTGMTIHLDASEA